MTDEDAREYLAASLASLVDASFSWPPNGRFWPVPGSPAATFQRCAKPRRTRGEAANTSMSHALAYFVATVDHIQTARSVMLSPSVLGSHAVSRLGIDSSSRLFWVCEPDVSSGERIRRAFLERERALDETRKQIGSTGDQRLIAETDARLERMRDAARNANIELTTKGRVAGDRVSSGELVQRLFEEFDVAYGYAWWGTLSGVVHSQPLTLISMFGGDRETSDEGMQFVPQVSGDSVKMAVSLQLEASRAAFVRFGAWCGWPVEPIAEVFERELPKWAFDPARIRPT